MSRRFRRILLVLACLLGGAFALRYALIPRYGPTALVYLAGRYGVSSSTFSAVEIVPGGLRVGAASLAWQPDGAETPSMVGRIENAELVGSIDSIRAGRLSRAGVEKVAFEINAGGSEEAAPQSDNSAVIWDSLQSMFPPLESVHVKHFSVVWRDQARNREMRIEGSASLDQHTLSVKSGASIELRMAEYGPVRLELLGPLMLTRALDGNDISIAPFAVRVQVSAVLAGMHFENIEIRTERFLLMKQGASGNVSLTGSIAFKKRPDIRFAPVRLQAALQFPLLASALPRAEGSFSMDKIEAGIVMSDLKTRFLFLPRGSEARASALVLSNASLGVLGGSVSSSNLEVSFDDQPHKASLQIKGINLEELFKIYPDGKVSGSGILDGNLNVETQSGFESVSARGTLVARPAGGILKGDLSTWVLAHPGNQGIAFAAQALENFQYSSLAATVEYASSGQLMVRLEIKGANQALNQGQAVNLNVGLEENLPALFESLRLLNQDPAGLAGYAQ
ncbi:MAG: YdbH domain-containing protein [Deltaproteobacteria bacterium]|nr:YdbH domain-containing protein [Deltaproteobacteria bacterium]